MSHYLDSPRIVALAGRSWVHSPQLVSETPARKSAGDPRLHALHFSAAPEHDHLFWDADNGEWVDAAKLKPGTHLRDVEDPGAQTVVAVKVPTGSEEMRDLTVFECRRRPAVSQTPLRVGDVFTIPIDDDRVGLGQVVGAWKGNHYFAVFDWAGPAKGRVDVDEALSSRLLFLALSMDAKIYVGHWKLLGSRDVVPGLPFPVYKLSIGEPTDVFVEDYSGTRRRRATVFEQEILPYRRVRSPVIFERALRAKYGLEPWLEAFTDLAPDDELTTARFFS